MQALHTASCKSMGHVSTFPSHRF